MNLIVKMKFGSHLYGTATPESDLDYKGVFMPSWEDLLLGRVPKSINESTGDNISKNTADDIDSEIYSIHYFIELACQGQTVAMDMLHAPDKMILEKSYIWDLIVNERDKFYTKNLEAFVGYARKQAAKYGIKGSRLSDTKRVIDFLKEYEEDERLKNIWDVLPEGEHIHNDLTDKNGLRLYQVCGRQFQETVKTSYVIDALEKLYDSYGARARLAERNENIDWKAVSHAIRAAIQVKELLTEGTITFPLKEADYLRKVKGGKLDYKTVVAPQLEALMDEVEVLSEASEFPEKVDRDYWEIFVIDMICNYYNLSWKED